MSTCAIVTTAKAVLSSVEAMRARCGVPSSTQLTSTNTASLCGDGGGRGLLSDTFWKIVAAVTDMSLLETVARPITPGEQVCHANPWIDQVRAWIDGIMLGAYTIVGSGFGGEWAELNVSICVDFHPVDTQGIGLDRYWSTVMSGDIESTVYPRAELLWDFQTYTRWRLDIGGNLRAIGGYADGNVTDRLPPLGVYPLREYLIALHPEELSGATITVLAGDQT